MQLAPAAWPLLQRLQGGAASSASLQAQLAPGGSTSRGVLAVELTSGPTAPRSVAVPVQLRPAGLPDCSLEQLGGALEVAASRAPAPAGLACLLAARLTCRPDCSGGLLLEGSAAVPAPILDFKPLLSKRVAATPLAERLQGLLHCPTPPEPEDGLLTMDRGRSLVPLAARDPAAYSLPLVGCWVAGAVDIRHPLVSAACLRFQCR